MTDANIASEAFIIIIVLFSMGLFGLLVWHLSKPYFRDLFEIKQEEPIDKQSAKTWAEYERECFKNNPEGPNLK